MSNLSRQFAQEFLYRDEDGVEYYTQKTTGISGMSRRGLGRFLRKQHNSINYWVSKTSAAQVDNNDLPECLKPFAGQRLVVDNNSDVLGAPFCAAMTIYYASYAAPIDQTPEAKFAAMVCMTRGLERHIQEKTGWTEQKVIEPSKPQAIQELELKLELARIELERERLVLSSHPNPVKMSKEERKEFHRHKTENDEKLDAVQLFLSQRIEITGNEGHTAKSAIVYRSYVNFCKTHKLPRFDQSQLIWVLKGIIPQCYRERTRVQTPYSKIIPAHWRGLIVKRLY